MKIRLPSLLAGLALAAAAPAPLAGQPCAGVPLGDASLAAGLLAGVAEYGIGDGARAADLGVVLHGRLPARLHASLDVVLRRPDGAPIDIGVLRASLRYPVLDAAGLQSCLTTGLGLAHGWDTGSDTRYTTLTLPLGVALGATFAAGPLELAPYAVPQLLLATVGGQVLGGDVDAQGWSTAVELGLGLRHGRLLGRLSTYLAEFDAALGTPAFPNRGLSVGVGWVF
jgi:hypothetical protein